MKTFVILALVAGCLGEAPYPPSGTRPAGPTLILPREYGAPRNSTPQKPIRGDVGVEEINANVMELLRQKPGSERGVYHVYLPDGRLQRVQYTTAPIREQSQGYTASQKQQYDSYYVRFPEERLQALRAPEWGASSQYYQASSPVYQPPREEGKVVGKLASIQFTDVKPIPAPIYSVEPKPLKRIIRESERESQQ